MQVLDLRKFKSFMRLKWRKEKEMEDWEVYEPPGKIRRWMGSFSGRLRRPGEFDKPPVVATTETDTKKPLGSFGRFMMVAFWVAVLVFGPGRLLKVVYLVVALGFLAVTALAKDKTFKSVVWDNNNWVFKSCLGMLIASILMAWLNPLLPPPSLVENLVGKVANFATGLLGFGEVYHPTVVGHHGVWRFFNRLYFGRSLTYGWRLVAVSFVGWTFISIFISFSDEVLAGIFHLLKNKASGKGVFAAFARAMVSDFVAGKVWHKLGVDV